MRALKLKNKLNQALVIFIGLIFTIHYANAVVLNRYSPEELIINEIIGNVFVALFLLSIPMFLTGVLIDSKNKKNFSMIKFIGAFLLYLILSYFGLMILAMLFLKYIYFFYPYYFTYIGIGTFLFIIYLFAKMSAKILNSNFFVVLSLFIIILYFLIFIGIN